MPTSISSAPPVRPVQPLLASVSEAAVANRARPPSSTWVRDAAPRTPEHELADVHTACELGVWPEQADARVVHQKSRNWPPVRAAAARVRSSHEPNLMVGERRKKLVAEWKEHLEVHVYPEVQSFRSASLQREILAVAERLASLDMTPQRACELYDSRIWPVERRDLMSDKVASALPYQAAAVVADQIGMPALSHLPVGLGASIVAGAAAVVDQFGQGVVGSVMTQKGSAHRWPRERSAQGLLRLIEDRRSSRHGSAMSEIVLPSAVITAKNLARAAGTVAFKAMGAPDGVADAFGILADLTGGTLGSASGGIRSEQLDRVEGFRRFLAFDGAATWLQRAAQQDLQTSKPAMGNHLRSAGQSVATTASQAVRGVPAGLASVFSWATLVKAGVLTAANTAARFADEKAKEMTGAKDEKDDVHIDTSVRLLDTAARDAARTSTRTAAVSSSMGGETSAREEAPLSEVALREFFAAAIGAGTALGLSSTDHFRSKANQAAEKNRLAGSVAAPSGLRRRNVPSANASSSQV